MLTPLSRALGSWTPGAGNGAAVPAREQGLGDVLSLWPHIVGEDVAQHALPLERTGDALLVLVSSSPWSNQLSLLAGHIVSALSDAGIGGIERLRFRIGRLPRASARRIKGPNAAATSNVSDEPGQPSASVEEAFSRFRGRIARSRDAKRARGWNQCDKCGAMLPEEGRCAPCVTAEASVRSARVQRLMFEVPWLGFRGIAEIVEGLTVEEYEANRTVLLSRWWETLERVRKTGKMDAGGYVRQIASSYLLLKTGWEPDRITPTIARNELTDDIYSLIYEKHDKN